MEKEPSFSFKSTDKAFLDKNANTSNKEINIKTNNNINNNIDTSLPDYFNNQGDSPKFNVTTNDIINDILDIPSSEMDFKNSIIHETEKKKKTSSITLNNLDDSKNINLNSKDNIHAPGVSKDADKTVYINIEAITNKINNTNNTENENNNISNNENKSNINKNLLAPINKKGSNKVLSNNAVYKSKNEIELPKKSHLEYLKIIKENKDPLGVKSSGGPKEITLEELSKHDQPHDMWMAINNEVYDLTMYIDYHPGGANKLMEGAGKDATDLFYENHPWVNIHNLVGKLQIGFLKK